VEGRDAAVGPARGLGTVVRAVEPEEKRLLRLGVAIHEAHRRGLDLLVDRLHALLRQRAGVLDLLSALAVGKNVKHAARAELLLELGILGVVVGLRLLLGVQVQLCCA
jgi:hypothetical protein